jgi:hypothetical protein
VSKTAYFNVKSGANEHACVFGLDMRKRALSMRRAIFSGKLRTVDNFENITGAHSVAEVVHFHARDQVQ